MAENKSNSDIITNFSVKDIYLKNDKLRLYAEMLKKYNIDIYEYLPKRPAKKIEFQLNASSAMANLIRASIWDWTAVWSLKVETSSIQTNDPFMLFDDLEQKIHGIPINQSFLNKAFESDNDQVYKKFKGSFSVINNTTQLKTITTNDFKFMYDKKEIEHVCSMIPFFRL